MTSDWNEGDVRVHDANLTTTGAGTALPSSSRDGTLDDGALLDTGRPKPWSLNTS